MSHELGVSRSALRDWMLRLEPVRREGPCRRCEGLDPPVTDGAAYSHLLGLYLGDGCISLLRKGVHSLRIACCDAYPRLMDECAASIAAVRPGTRTYRVRAQGCTHVTALWKHWPCLFPQHGPGRKHQRPIVLDPWQEAIIREHRGRFLRGLFHSDGCRITNWTVATVAGKPKRYEYPRYFFTNVSDDIMRLCEWGARPRGHRAPPDEADRALRRPKGRRRAARRPRWAEVLTTSPGARRCRCACR